MRPAGVAQDQAGPCLPMPNAPPRLTGASRATVRDLRTTSYLLRQRRSFFHQGRAWTLTLRSINEISSIARLYSIAAFSASAWASLSMAQSVLIRIDELPTPRFIRSSLARAFFFCVSLSNSAVKLPRRSARTVLFSRNKSASISASSIRLRSSPHFSRQLVERLGPLLPAGTYVPRLSVDTRGVPPAGGVLHAGVGAARVHLEVAQRVPHSL